MTKPPRLRNGSELLDYDYKTELRDRESVVKALAHYLSEGDVDTVKEIIRAHYQTVNTDKAIRRAGMSPRTFYHAVGPKGNPSLATLGAMLKAMSFDGE